jgi:ribosomal protein S18 acetylase RimI-like enzyme
MALPAEALENSGRIRRLNLSSDLDHVADLIETCFPIASDPDGQTYIREMRKAARDMRLLGWLSNLEEMGSSKAAGFVWEESGKIIGNLSLIPFQRDGHRIHLIANVAVHPAHRRKGVGRALTQHALSYLRRRGEPETWLQVKEDNQAAITLYQSAGFTQQAVRTTWRIRPMDYRYADVAQSDGLVLKQRRQTVWQQHQAWLAETYPYDLRWNLTVDFSRFTPGLLQQLMNLIDGVRLKHWAFYNHQDLQGVITWQKTSAFAHNLWVAFSPDHEADVLPGALARALRTLSRKHPLSIDYPAGRLSQVLQALGFEPFRTLIWMRCVLKN